MFEITPFTSFNEFIDMEDFIVRFSSLDKYKSIKRKQKGTNRMDDFLYYTKIDQIRREIDVFNRFFNMTSYAPPTEYEAQQMMCILMPETATIEEICYILNPIYNEYIEEVERLLVRMSYRVLINKFIHMKTDDAKVLFKEKFD